MSCLRLTTRSVLDGIGALRLVLRLLIGFAVPACIAAADFPGRDAAAADAVLGEKGAKALAIADVHFHVMPFMDPKVLLQHMDRNGIRWAGGAFAVPPEAWRAAFHYQASGNRWEKSTDPSPKIALAMQEEAAAALGKRFIRATGQGFWIGMLRQEGVSAPENLASPAGQRMLSLVEIELRDRDARVVGEILVNNSTSSPSPQVSFKTRADAPVLKALFDLATKYKRPLNVHAEWAPDTAEQLGRLADSNRSGVLWLAHCSPYSRASDIRAFFEAHPNVWCDLSFRSAPQLSGAGLHFSIYHRSGVNSDWKKLIEDYPDRFVVGIDDVYSWGDYEEVARNIRFGLLANLSPRTAAKVAYENARALFNLE